MKKLLLVILIIFIFPAISLADEVEITVDGMVCSFCAQGIRKSFESRDDVEKVEVSLENKNVVVHFKDGAKVPDDEVLTTIINDAGYAPSSIERKENKKE